MEILNLIREGIISSEKWEIQVIITMIMLTRSSERIFSPSRYTGYNYDYAHSLFGNDL